MDARLWWDRAYRNPINRGDTEPSEFAIEVAAGLEPRSRVLELGCGTGEDSLHFARAGHQVTASDFVWQRAAWADYSRAVGDALQFVLLDMRHPLPFRDGTFDVVYARLTLHYFATDQTHRIFGEIHRILTPNGILAFLCKSINDPLYGQGELVGPDMFRLSGKVRHFFDEEFVSGCLGEDFSTQRLWSESIVTPDGPSHVVGAVARNSSPVER